MPHKLLRSRDNKCSSSIHFTLCLNTDKLISLNTKTNLVVFFLLGDNPKQTADGWLVVKLVFYGRQPRHQLLQLLLEIIRQFTCFQQLCTVFLKMPNEAVIVLS